VSSLAIIIWGAYGLHRHWCTAEPRTLAAFFGMAVVGVGSVGFHATLLHSMQWADELPMVWTNSVMVYMILAIDDKPGRFDGMRAIVGTEGSAKARRRRGVAALAGFTVLQTLAIFCFDSKDQVAFLLCFGVGSSGVAAWHIGHWGSARYGAGDDRIAEAEEGRAAGGGALPAAGRRRGDPGPKAALLRPATKGVASAGAPLGGSPGHSSRQDNALLCWTMLSAYLLAMLCWLVDREFCGPAVRPLQLHSMWHILMSWGTYTSLLRLTYARGIVLRQRPALVGLVGPRGLPGLPSAGRWPVGSIGLRPAAEAKTV
jgi:hypothetical protein